MVTTVEELRLVLRTEIDRASQQWTRGTRRIEQQNQSLTRSLRGLNTALGAIGLTFGSAALVRGTINYLNTAQRLENQLRLVTDGFQDLENVQRSLLDISQETRTSLESNTTVFARVTRATSELGLSQEEVLQITSNLSKAVAVSGVSAQEASNALIQLSQGLASGALRGDEFNSVAEQLSTLLPFLADELGTTTGNLRALAAEGKITADVVSGALLNATDELDKALAQTAPTIEQNVTTISNAFTDLVSELDEFLGLSDKAGAALSRLAQVTQSIADGLREINSQIDPEGGGDEVQRRREQARERRRGGISLFPPTQIIDPDTGVPLSRQEIVDQETGGLLVTPEAFRREIFGDRGPLPGPAGQLGSPIRSRAGRVINPRAPLLGFQDVSAPLARPSSVIEVKELNEELDAVTVELEKQEDQTQRLVAAFQELGFIIGSSVSGPLANAVLQVEKFDEAIQRAGNNLVRRLTQRSIDALIDLAITGIGQLVAGAGAAGAGADVVANDAAASAAAAAAQSAARRATQFQRGGIGSHGQIFSSPTFFGLSDGGLGVLGEGPDRETILPLAEGPQGLGVRAIGGGGGGNTTIIIQGARDPRDMRRALRHTRTDRRRDLER